MSKPFESVLSSSKEDVGKVAEDFQIVKTMVKPIINEIESDDIEGEPQTQKNNKTERTIKEKYRNKLERRCRAQLQKGAGKCRQAFKETMDSCMESLPYIINHLLCWPLRIDFICDINIIDPDKACVPDDTIVDDNFEKSYNQLKKISNETVSDNEKGMTMEYKVMTPEEYEFNFLILSFIKS